MQNLNIYILEKLKLNKSSRNELDFPVKLELWVQVDDIYRMKDHLHDYSNIIRFGISKKQRGVNNFYLYSIEVENKEDLLSLLIYCYFNNSSLTPKQEEIFDSMKVAEEYIENYKDLEEYINSYTKQEYQEALDKIRKLYVF